MTSPVSHDSALTAEGPFSRKRYTAAWVPLEHEKVDARDRVYPDSEGRPGCWTYRDDRGYGPSLGWIDNRHPSAEKALETAVAHDVFAAAQGAPFATRSEYEAEASRLGLPTIWDDRACEHMIGGDWDLPTYGVQGAAERTLAVRRGLTVRAAKERPPPSPSEQEAMDVAMQIVDLEAQAQDAEDRDDLNRAWKLRAKAKALRTGG